MNCGLLPLNIPCLHLLERALGREPKQNGPWSNNLTQLLCTAGAQHLDRVFVAPMYVYDVVCSDLPVAHKIEALNRFGSDSEFKHAAMAAGDVSGGIGAFVYAQLGDQTLTIAKGCVITTKDH